MLLRYVCLYTGRIVVWFSLYSTPYLWQGWSSANSVVFGECKSHLPSPHTASLISVDMIHAFGQEITQWNTRLVGFACISIVTAIHIFHLNSGLRVQNALAIVKFGIMIFIILCGFLAGIGIVPLAQKSRNFENIWEGSSRDPNAFVAGLFNVLWYLFLLNSLTATSLNLLRSFNGYSNAHYALSETKDPVKTIKRAAPIAIGLMTTLYLLVNISYLVVVPKEQMQSGGRVVAWVWYSIVFTHWDNLSSYSALYFGNLFGNLAERVFILPLSYSKRRNLKHHFPRFFPL